MKAHTFVAILTACSISSAGLSWAEADTASVQAELRDMRKQVERTQGAEMEAVGWACIRNMDRLSKMGQAAGPEVLNWFLDKGVPQRMRILLGEEVLPRISGPQALTPLQNIIRDKNEPPPIRAAAAKALGSIGGKESLQTLVSASENLESQGMQVSILRALGAIGAKEGVATIAKQLHNKDPYVVVVAARALHAIAQKTHDDTIDAPLLALAEDETFKYRGVVAGLLGDSRNPNSIATLARTVQDPKADEQARWGAAKSLAKIGGKESVKALLPVFQDPSEYMRSTTVQAAFEAGMGEEGLPYLEKALETSHDKYVRRKIQGTIYRVQGKFGPNAHDWTHDNCVKIGNAVFMEVRSCKQRRQEDQPACLQAVAGKLPPGAFINCGCVFEPAWAEFGSRGCDLP
ncbi:MAG: HEAT repeat domain-containing protein [Elusimicrobia bacterium]|nr:HEAT repeat domain-containing protein [Elusimicrobiota bacterium]